MTTDYKLANIKKARALWEEAKAADPQAAGLHPRIAGYLAARGIDVGRVLAGPGVGKGVWSLRFMERCLDTEGMDGGAQRYVQHFWPAMVAPIVFGGAGGKGQIRGVHRTYLHPTQDRKRTEEDAPSRGAPKKMLGHASGGVIRLGTSYAGGVLILTEGIETGLAVMQATGYTVWAAGSAGSLPECVMELPEEIFRPVAMGGKGVHTVIVAADLNRPGIKKGSTVPDPAAGKFLETVTGDPACGPVVARMQDADVLVGRWAVKGVGERMGKWAMWRLESRFPWVTCEVRSPSRAVAPDLIEESEDGTDGAFGDRVRRVVGKRSGLDWLDVLVAARARGLSVEETEDVVRGGVLYGIDPERLERARLAMEAFPHGEDLARAEVGSFAGGEGDGEGGGPDPDEDVSGTRASSPILGVGGEGGAGGGGGGESGDGREEIGGGEGGDGRGSPWDAYQFGVNRPVIDVGPLERARRFLWERMRLPGARRFLLARWASKWWVWEDGRYIEMPDETLRGMVMHWLGGFDEIADGKMRRFRPGTRTVAEVMQAMVGDTTVYAMQPPMMIPATLTEAGSPRWGAAASVEDLSKHYDSDEQHSPLVAFRNGSLDLRDVVRTGRVAMKPHDPRLFATARLPFELSVADADQVLAGGEERDMALHRLCPNWMRWLRLASGDDLAWENQLQEMFGDTISMDRSIEKVYMAVGKQRAGKGVMQEALVAVLGVAAVVSTTFSALTSDRYALYPLVGKAAAIMPDAHVASFGEGPQAVEVLKAISGQDRVQVRDLYTSYQTVRLSCRFWIFCNEEPNLRDESSAFANRLIILPLEHSALGNEDPTIKRSIPREAAGIMLWALEGAMRLARRTPRRIEIAAESQRWQGELERMSAPLKAFVADCVSAVDDGVGLTADELYKAYVWWCEQQGREPMKQPRFFSGVKSHMPGLTKWSQPRVGESRRRHMRGLAIRDDIARQMDPSGKPLPTWHDQP